MKKIIFWSIFLAIVAVAAFFIIRHLTTTEEGRVRSAVNGLISDLEKDNVYLCMWGLKYSLSDKYVHEGENVDFKIDKDLALQFIAHLKATLGYVDFKVEIMEMTVTLDGDAARVVVTGRITAAREDKPDERIEVMTDGGHNKAVLDFRKEGGDWMVVRSERLKYDLPPDPPARP